MEVSGTISSYLEGEDKFDYLFWTSYSMDPITVEFLFKNDLVSCLNKPYFHFICDKNKIDETIENCLDDPKRINRLSQMQNYLMLSHEKVEGAFHPKILFFSSIHKVKSIVLSGNATSSGILSNQDLIAKFEWPDSGSDDYRSELASIYQFLRSFEGWNSESKSELDSVAETHPWLLELSSERVYFSDGTTPLLNQLKAALPFDWAVEQILIFSPFVDPELRALTEIAKTFAPAEVVLFYPGIAVEVNNPNVILPGNLSIRSSDTLNKTRFHAKYFTFLGKDKAHALWGSANCSFSALLSPHRNKEILIGYDIDPKRFHELWPGSSAESHSKFELVRIGEKENEFQSNEIELLAGRIEDGTVSLEVNKDFSNKGFRLLLFNGEEQDEGPVSSIKGKIEFQIENAQKICGVYICNAVGEKISNVLFLNNFEKIRKSISGEQGIPNYDHLKEKQRELVSRLGKEFFVLDRDKASTGSKNQQAHSFNAFAFWHMPQYRKRLGTVGIFGHGTFISNYVTKQKARRDSDGDGSNGDNDSPVIRPRGKQDRTAFSALAQQSKRILSTLKVQTKDIKLENKIPFDRWLKGEEYMVRFFLETIDEYEVLEERDLSEIKTFLRCFLRTVFYTIGKLKIRDYEDGMNFIRSLNMLCSVYLLLTKYSWSKMSFERGTLSTTAGFHQYMDDLADAGYMKIIAERCLAEHELDRAYEAKTLLLEHVTTCLHHARAASEALTFTAPGLQHVDETIIEQNDIVDLKDELFLFNGVKESNTLNFTNMFGTTKSFRVEYVNPRAIYSFKSSLV
ncbi:hypothetical protein ACFL0N_01450 [Pseudomonadota bacterium]